MPLFRSAPTQLFDRDSRSESQTSSLVLGGLTRRSLFHIGGVSLAGAALLAACGSDTKSAATTGVATTIPGTTVPGAAASPAMSSDVVILRTASSIEELAVAAY